MGFPPHHSSPQRNEPEAPVSPPSPGLLLWAEHTYEDFYDWQSYVRLRSVDGFRNLVPLCLQLRPCLMEIGACWP
jgi:hypothetical protein